MIRGIYIAGSGMLAESVRQDVVANNLANATTTGFKRSQAVASPFSEFLLRNMGVPGRPLVGTMNMGAQIQDIAILDEQGHLRSTGNRLDLALIGDGYFTVAGPNGTAYTRDGSFQVDEQGRLVTKDGLVVAGVGGPITIGEGEVRIAQDGTVTQDGAVRGRLQLTSLDPETLRKEGLGLVGGTPTGTADARVRQGFLEASTVNVVTEMVELIRVMRSFEANQKALQAHDEALQQATTQVGRTG